MKTKQDVYQQLSKEITRFIQDNCNKTEECIKFVEYELRLRFVSKRELQEISKEIDGVEEK